MAAEESRKEKIRNEKILPNTTKINKERRGGVDI